MTDPASAWQPSVASLLANLEAPAASGPVELQVPEIGRAIFIGMDERHHRWVRITCPPRSVSVDETSAAVSFRIVGDGYMVTVAPTVEKSVARAFLGEIVSLVADGEPPGSAGQLALRNWRELLARPPGQVLDENQLAGLYGELEILETILVHSGSIGAWTGWQRDQNDFRLPGLVIEVKTTLSPNYRRVRIHGLAQLADPQDGSDLVLVLRRLERSPTGRSVPDLVDACVDKGAPRAELLEHLANVGYSEQHRPRYRDVRFVSQEIALRSIDDEHPRITTELLGRSIDLAPIDRVDYVLDLDGTANSDLDTNLEDLIAARLDHR